MLENMMDSQYNLSGGQIGVPQGIAGMLSHGQIPAFNN